MTNLAADLFDVHRPDWPSDSGGMPILAAGELLGARQHIYSADSVILAEGEASASVRLVRSGWVTSATQLRDGSRQIIDVYLKDDLLFPQTVAGGSRVSLHAVDRAVTLEFPLARLVGLASQRPDLARICAAATARLGAIHLEHLVNLGQRGAAARTAHFFLELAERAAPGDGNAALSFECPLTQTDLADALGMTAIHLNRTLRDLRLLGFMTFRRGTVLIKDRPRLARLADFSPDYLDAGDTNAAGNDFSLHHLELGQIAGSTAAVSVPWKGS
jgi:CRP-like cAMP-binding protein